MLAPRARSATAAGLIAAALLACACAEPGPASAPSASPSASTAGVPPLHPSVDGYPQTALAVRTADATVEVPALVADTPARRQHGLMEVAALPAGVGMWFVYDGDQTGGFWMKGTLIPLDVAFVAADGAIVDIIAMTPCVADPCPIYEPSQSYRTALEMRGGWFAAMQVGVGDTVVEAA